MGIISSRALLSSEGPLGLLADKSHVLTDDIPFTLLSEFPIVCDEDCSSLVGGDALVVVCRI
jgi:hypothetical protein